MPDEELTEDIKRVLRKHDPDADTVRAVANGLEDYAEKLEAMEAAL